ILIKDELAVLKIDRFWQETKMNLEIQTMLSKPHVINGFVEIIFNSVDTRVLKATVFLLCEVGSRDSNVISTLTRVYYDVECIIALFDKGLFEAVVLIYLLKPSISTFLELDMADSLLSIVQKREDQFLKINVVADKAELAPVLESFLDANDQDRFAIVQFLSELVRLNRKTFNDQILHIIKDEGTFSTMHTLLIYLQTALTDQSPIIAGLLLQLDLVV
ncbi:hypothetical protein Tco_1479141, partial [Tanacetum coccineum]